MTAPGTTPPLRSATVPWKPLLNCPQPIAAEQNMHTGRRNFCDIIPPRSPVLDEMLYATAYRVKRYFKVLRELLSLGGVYSLPYAAEPKRAGPERYRCGRRPDCKGA